MNQTPSPASKASTASQVTPPKSPQTKSLWRNLSTWVTLGLLIFILWPSLRWAFVDAVWLGTQPGLCQNAAGESYPGACWPAVWANLQILFFYHYPAELLWRPAVSLVITLSFVFLLLRGSLLSSKGSILAIGMVATALGLMGGGVFGLEAVPTSKWGGLVLTLNLSVFAVVIAFPLGLLLALGRRSPLIIVKAFCTGWIELIRGVPLITLLFTAQFILPLFLPATWASIDPLLRAVTAMILFGAAYIAEVIRGGLQTIEEGQYEAAHALGLSYPQSMGLVVLPQALKISIPPLISTFIGLMKDTTLVSIIGIFDLLGAAREIPANPMWIGKDLEILIFAGFVYWAFCVILAKYGLWLEQRLSTARP